MSTVTKKMVSIEGALSERRRQSRADGSASDFAFVPQELTVQCRSLIERYHRIHGYACLFELLWRADTRAFIENHKALRRIFKKACMARYIQRANSSLLFVATAIMTLEALVRNFSAWGTRFPDTRQRAEELLSASPFSPRVWLMDTYICTPHRAGRIFELRFASRMSDAKRPW
ncbi:MAG: hypothetical protein WCA56_13265 [Xanthobacteraceae bacterium]|jgi:hypothetical protein